MRNCVVSSLWWAKQVVIFDTRCWALGGVLQCGESIGGGSGRGQLGPTRFVPVSFVLVVGPGDGGGAKGDEGEGAHGALEPPRCRCGSRTLPLMDEPDVLVTGVSGV